MKDQTTTLEQAARDLVATIEQVRRGDKRRFAANLNAIVFKAEQLRTALEQREQAQLHTCTCATCNCRTPRAQNAFDEDQTCCFCHCEKCNPPPSRSHTRQIAALEADQPAAERDAANDSLRWLVGVLDAINHTDLELALRAQTACADRDGTALDQARA